MKKSSKPQKERFIEKAKELAVDETGKTFENTFGKIVKPKKAIKK